MQCASDSLTFNINIPLHFHVTHQVLEENKEGTLIQIDNVCHFKMLFENYRVPQKKLPTFKMK